MGSVGCRGATLSFRSDPRALLRGPGYAIVPVSDHLAASLTIALKAFEGQLSSWGRHPPPEGYTGFTAFPRKSRLEFRPGHAGLGNLGVLQQMASQVCVVEACCLLPVELANPSLPKITAGGLRSLTVGSANI